MFRPVPMLRLSAVVLQRDERAALRGLGRLGAVQLLRTRPGPDTAPLEPLDRTEELARWNRFLARVEDLRRALEMPIPAATTVAPAAATLGPAEEKLRWMEEQAEALLGPRQRLRQRQSELAATSEQVSVYRGLELPLDPVGQFSFLHFVTGNLPAENLAQVQQEVGETAALLPLPPKKGRQPLIALTTRRGRAALESALQRAGFQAEALPELPGATVDTLADESQREQDQVAGELERLHDELRRLAAEAGRPLAELEELANTERILLEAGSNFPRTEATILITGWIAAADFPVVEQRLRETTGNRCALDLTPPENVPEEQIPVLLRPPRLLRPFEILVAGYGLPRYREIAPTLFVAISYVLMFGMMFGDAGHGAILAVAGLIALLCSRTARMRDVGLLLLSGGLSSVCFGIVYGSYFGLPQLKAHALWHDPLEGNPMGLMWTAMGIGVVMISLGLMLNVINRFWRKDLIGGCLDKFGLLGLLFYWGALALLTQHEALQARGLVNLAAMLFLVLPLIGWTLKEPLEYALRRRAGHPAEPGSGFFAAITESLVGAFEAVLSYLANTISFVRLAAYAMSHAALLMATFVVAAEVQRVSAWGALLGALVIVIGNVIALLLEGIVASVQALRLEYYEFFGKFFSGSGQPFKPFHLHAQVQT